jgi:hypothetical protein
MIIRPQRTEGGSVSRRLSPAFWLVAGLASVMFPTLADAQVNIDQGKSPAEIYSADCATCHKTPRGLAAGKNSLMLSSFLREHYTASSGEAAALAAYVLGAGGAEPAPKQKPDTEHARAEEPKAGEPKTTTHPLRASARPEDEKRPKEQETTREGLPVSPATREKPYETPQTASREGKPEPENAAPVVHEPAPIAAAPATSTAPNAAEPSSPVPNNLAPSPAAASGTSPMPAPTASATVPAEEQSGASVPRDNIPD